MLTFGQSRDPETDQRRSDPQGLRREEQHATDEEDGAAADERPRGPPVMSATARDMRGAVHECTRRYGRGKKKEKGSGHTSI